MEDQGLVQACLTSLDGEEEEVDILEDVMIDRSTKTRRKQN